MRVLLVCDLKAATTGGYIHVREEKRLLEEKGHEVLDFTCGYRFGGMASYLSRFFNPGDYLRMKRVISRFAPDVIHVHGIHACLSPLPLLAVRKEIPIVMTLHDYHYVCPKVWMIYEDGRVCDIGFSGKCLFAKCPPRHMILYDWMRWFKVWLHRKLLKKRVRIFTAPSADLAAWVSRSLEVEVEILPNFIYLSSVSDSGLPESNQILCPARLRPEKGVEYAVRAMPMILDRVPDARLIVVGEGPEKERLSSIARELEVSEAVHFTGWVDHQSMEGLYKGAKVVVAPSIWVEAFGVVAVEAFYLGRPVVASDMGGFKGIVRDGENGYLVEPRNAARIADRVIRILEDPGLLARMSSSAQEHARRYGRELYLDGLEAVLFPKV